MTEPRVASKYRTGFCESGCHEGTKPKSPSGRPMKVCELWQKCSCECHKVVTQIFKDADMPRELMDNSEYIPFERSWYMPVFGVDYGIDRLALASDPIDSPDYVKPNGHAAPGARTFAPTPSGYAARGQLEDQVLEICIDWNIDTNLGAKPELCTPSYVSKEVARLHKTSEPSTGAVGAVFGRWVKYDFALLGEKPVRFVGFTEIGLEKGFDYMRAKYRREKRRAER